MKNLIENGNYYPEIIALIIANNLHMFVITYMFVIIGAYARDYWQSINEYETEIKIKRIMLFGFILSWIVFSQIDKFPDISLYLAFCLIVGLFYYGVSDLAMKYSEDKSFIKKVINKFIGIIYNWSNNNDNKE